MGDKESGEKIALVLKVKYGLAAQVVPVRVN